MVLINSIISEIVQHTGFSDDEAKEFLNEYLKEVPSMIEDLLNAISNDDFALIASKAHLLKGSCANLRIHNLKELSLKLEKSAKSKDLVQCDLILIEIREYYSLLLEKTQNLSFKT